MTKHDIKSEIRPSEITALLDRVKKNAHEKYLREMRIGRMRGLEKVTVSFDFPVTALIGPNGGGKSTVLGAAACAYKETKPGIFFPKSSIGDDFMSEWNVEYVLVDRDRHTNGQNGNWMLRRKIKFKAQRWVRDNLLSRELSYFGINRTVAVGERPEFKRLMKPYEHRESLDPFPDEIAKQIESILGKSMENFRKTRISSGKNVFYIGDNQGQSYSEFHFGAGESSIIRIVSAIENMPENSLILIEELENGLHPVALRRLVEYLITSASRKRNQVIFTTHSDEALLPLPSEAIWACFDGQVQQGKLSVKSLRMITGKIEKKLAIFVEDDFAKIIMESILQICFDSDLDVIAQTEVHVLSGDGTAVKIHKNRQKDPASTYKSICVLDGDSRQSEEIDQGVIKLPGHQPELTVFQDTESDIQNRVGRLTAYLQLEATKQQDVIRVVEEVSHTCRDPHLYFSQIGEKLGFVSTQIVQSAFVKLWIQANRGSQDKEGNHVEKFHTIVSQIKQSLTAINSS